MRRANGACSLTTQYTGTEARCLTSACSGRARGLGCCVAGKCGAGSAGVGWLVGQPARRPLRRESLGGTTGCQD
jgi:hypothetical protein